MRLDSSRARRRDADSEVRSSPTTTEVASRGQEEDDLIEDEEVRVDGSVASDRGAGDEGARAERSDHHSAPLALEVRVGGDQEQRRQLHAEERVRRDELDGEEEREVDRRHDRVERSLRVAAREGQHPDRPQHEDGQHEARATVVGEAHDRDGREGGDRHDQARHREHHDRSRRVDRDAAHHASDLTRVRQSWTATSPAPAESISQSTGVPWRPSTKVW